LLNAKEMQKKFFLLFYSRVIPFHQTCNRDLKKKRFIGTNKQFIEKNVRNNFEIIEGKIHMLWTKNEK